MRDETVARSYAEALFDVAQRHEGLEAFGDGLEALARLLDESPDFRRFLETPRVDRAAKKAVLTRAFEGRVPLKLLHFVLLTIDKRRQRLLREIARQYHALVDDHLGRRHVEVSVARALDQDVLARLTAALSGMLGATAVPHVRVRPELLGGVLVRAGDTIYDGSLKRRLDRMRMNLLAAELPAASE